MSLDILDVNGRLVRSLDDRVRFDAAPRLRWDGRDSRGRTVVNGVYLARLTTVDGVSCKRILLLK